MTGFSFRFRLPFTLIEFMCTHFCCALFIIYFFCLYAHTHAAPACCYLLLLTELGTQQNSLLITTERDARPTHRLEALVANLKNELANKCGRRGNVVEWRE